MKATKKDLHESGRVLTKEEFIQKIKENDEFSNKWGDLGRIYGAQWRKWRNPSICKISKEFSDIWDGRTHTEIDCPIDQFSELITQLKENPDSRRLMVNAWAVHDLSEMVLPPCHYGFQVYTRKLSVQERKKYDKYYDDLIGERPDHHITLDKRGVPSRAISLMWNQRSVDTFLGLPFNIASYGLLLEIIAKEVNMVPDELIGNLGDVHLYSNHIEQAKEQIGRKYTHEERTELLKQAMGEERYYKAVDELMPFGGGLSEYYDSYKIPYITREPYPLPTLKELPDYLCIRENWECYEIDDIQIENYQSHPTIKAPLSN
jgi:thymidylate synthase